MFVERVIWLNGGLLLMAKAGVGYGRILDAGCNTRCKEKQKNASWEARKMFGVIHFFESQFLQRTEKGSYLCHIVQTSTCEPNEWN